MLAKVQLDSLVFDLKARRLSLGLQLKDVVKASGLSKVAVSQLENGWLMNPTLDTIFRYAMALGRRSN
jgi:transcriptional regulator with XRE-family HTH domain